MSKPPGSQVTPNHDRWWRLRYRLAPWFFLAPLLPIFCIFILYPLERSFVLSFHKTAGPRAQVFVGLGNYRYLLLHDRVFWLSALNTVAFTVAFLLLQIPISLGLALLLTSRRVIWRNFFRFSFFSSYLVGQVFVGVLFFELFSPTGMVNRILGLGRGRPAVIPWLSSPNLAMPVVLIAMIWLTSGYGMIYFLAALQAVDPELYAAAEVDGAGRWQSFLHVTLPGIKPVMVYVILMGTIAGFQLFELPYVLLQGAGPGGRGLTLVMYLFNNAFGAGDLGYASAIGWILMLLLMGISLAQIRLMRAGQESAA